jgi:hypothetical protein
MSPNACCEHQTASSPWPPSTLWLTSLLPMSSDVMARSDAFPAIGSPGEGIPFFVGPTVWEGLGLFNT